MSRYVLPSLMQFIPKLSPGYTEPRHLAPFVEAFERIRRGEVLHMVVSIPPGHEKTETASHGIVWLLKQNPALRVCYGSYGQRISSKKSRRIRQLAERARVPLDRDASSTADWRTGVDEGGMWATSVGGAAIGERFDLIVLDDVIKDRFTAENALARDRIHQWITGDVLSREEPRCSTLLVMHRWHCDDPAERLVKAGWEEIKLPAINAAGEALCPKRFPIEWLRHRERITGPYAFASLYQQDPNPRGSTLMEGVHCYERIPPGCRYACGVDLAYTAKARADYSVAIPVAIDADGIFYILDVIRMQTIAPDFASVLHRIKHTYPGIKFASYVSGVEKGSLDFMERGGLKVEALPAKADKFVRAQSTAAAWNDGRIRVPREAKWLNKFVEEIVGFTGVGDRNDDQVDALVSVFDAKELRGNGLVAAIKRKLAGDDDKYDPTSPLSWADQSRALIDRRAEQRAETARKYGAPMPNVTDALSSRDLIRLRGLIPR